LTDHRQPATEYRQQETDVPEFTVAERLRKLPPYLFSEIDKKKKAAIAAGRDVINLGIGDPDTPTPEFIIEALHLHARNPRTHTYALDDGDPTLRAAVARWFAKRFGVELDPDAEVFPTIGSKEAIGHFPLAYLNPGEAALIPVPGYPPYRSGTIFAGAEPIYMPLRRENGFLPDLGAISPADAERARLIYVNYPNNPTGAVASREFYGELVAFAAEHDLIIASDAAYAELAFDGFEPISLLSVPGAKERTIEFHSWSKTFNMTGWRIGFAAGSAALCAGLGRVKSNLDSGIFTAIQLASVNALERYDQFVPGLRAMYQKRRDAFCDRLAGLGLEVPKPAATFYVWFPTPEGRPSFEVAGRILEEADVVLIPGAGFGEPGEGFLRAALTVPEERLAEAAERIGRIAW
jgi:LL-diaminopimelate aminotransferase